MNQQPKERRDWRLIVLILLLGLFLMFIAGQIAIYLSPNWSIKASMISSLQMGSPREAGLVPPVLPGILTPLSWLDTFLTPHPNSENSNLPAAPLVVLEPTSTPGTNEAPS